jgi:hypothetical protein
MFQFFHSLFSGTSMTGGYPDTLVTSAIERAVEHTDPWIRAVSGYRRKLQPAVLRAIDHVVALVDGMAPPIGLEPAGYGNDPLLRNFFISTADMRKVLDNDRTLSEFRRQRGGAAMPRINALLTMEKQEKTVLGAELSGTIILHDVSQITVSFEDHHLVDPAESEKKTRRQLKRRAFDHLLSLALKRIAIVKMERSSLERYRTIIESRLNLRQRRGWGVDSSGTAGNLNVTGMQEQLERIERQLKELGREDQVLEVYLDIVSDVLSRPEEHLWAKKERLIVDRMGIKRSEAAGDAPEVTLDVVHNVEGRSLVVSLVTLSGEAGE